MNGCAKVTCRAVGLAVVVAVAGCSSPPTRGEQAYWRLAEAGVGSALAVGGGVTLGTMGVLTGLNLAVGERSAVQVDTVVALPTTLVSALVLVGGAWLWWDGYSGFTEAIDRGVRDEGPALRPARSTGREFEHDEPKLIERCKPGWDCPDEER